jgi:phosphatidate cytidylyltransferase
MTRVASAAVLIALIVLTLWMAPPWATVALAAVAAALAAGELAGLARAVGADVSPIFLGAAAAVVCAAFAWQSLALAAGDDVLDGVLLVYVLAAGAMVLSAGPPGPAMLARAGVAFMGPIYVGLPLGAIASIRILSGAPAVFWLLLVVAVSDSAQYYSGRAFGRRKLAPAVSPAKTVEGAIGGLVAATIAGALAGPRLVNLVPLTMATGAAAGLFVAAFGILGDLFESLLKRSAGVKDSSSLIPGHGGVLDRIDSYLFAAPCYYVVLRWLV